MAILQLLETFTTVPMQMYFQKDRSNLKLSCENWVLIDYLELKYIRGWIPKEEKETKIAIQLFITSILMNL